MSKHRCLYQLFFISVFSFSTWAHAQSSRIDSLEQIVTNAANPSEKLNTYLALVELYNTDYPSEKGIRRAIEGLELATKLQDQFARTRLLRLRGELHNELYQDEYERSLSYFFEALEISRRLNSKPTANLDHQKEMASSMNSIAYLYWQWGKLNQSRLYYDSAIAVSTRIWDSDSTYGPNVRLLGLEHNSQGAVLWGMGDYGEAISKYFKAINYFEIAGMTKHMSLTNCNIGLIYDSWGQTEEALFYFRRAVELGMESGDPSAIGYALSNMGRFKETAKEFDSALYYYERSTESYTTVDNMWGIGLNLIGTGRMYANMGDFDKSLQAFRKALERAEMNDTHYWIAQSKYNISKTLNSKKAYASALQFARESNGLAEEHGYKEISKDNYLNISNIYGQLGDFQNAYINYQLHSALRDSLFTEEKFKHTTMMKEQFETARKENENEILRRDRLLQDQNLERARMEKFGLILLLLVTLVFAVYFVVSMGKIKRINRELSSKHSEITRQKEELGQQASELKKSNEIKNLMFSIVSHDLRSPIVNVGNLVHLLNNNELSLEELRKLLPSVSANIGNITNLTDNLLYWARSQMEGIKVAPKSFDLHEHMVAKLPLYDKAAKDKGVVLSNRLSPGTLIYADTYMVELIIRNLISNAIKFCIAGNNIELSAEMEGNHTTVTVKDTGQGIPTEYMHRIFNDAQFSTLGTHNERGVGLGLMMCKHFVELNGGKIWVETVYGKGSSFYFSLPGEGTRKASKKEGAEKFPSSVPG